MSRCFNRYQSFYNPQSQMTTGDVLILSVVSLFIHLSSMQDRRNLLGPYYIMSCQKTLPVRNTIRTYLKGKRE